MRVLAVEDDRRLLATIVNILREEGYEADGVETGDDGLYLAQQGIYDLLVVDIMLPGMSGLDIVRTLRAEGAATERPNRTGMCATTV
ncbi:response regulator [Thermobacillus sp.]|uniref:response regulator n=1 Tax=Thermobacillus sp. TaxID=2108467 RepID=UPI00267C554D